MILYFTGSDVLLLNEYPKQLSKRKHLYIWLYRMFVRMSSFCVEGIAVTDEHLINELQLFGFNKEITVVHSNVLHKQKYCRFPHKGFNVFYYCPGGSDQRWNKWVYGHDIFCKVRDHYKDDQRVNFIRSWGQFDMTATFPITDFMLRPNRHDGDARMIQEAIIQGIPYYWSYENPDFDEIIKAIDNAKRRRYKNTRGVSVE